MCNTTKALCLTLYVTVLYSCNYANSVRQETIKKFEKSKSHMVHIAFEGQIIEKNYCAKCEITKYTLKIRLSSISEKIGFMELSFPPYLEYNDTILRIIVSKDLFTQVTEKQLISKASDSHYIKTAQLKLLYLSEKDKEWIP
jgi:hypothetical protein